MHRTYIADIERGARNLTLRSVLNLATALQVAVGDLLSYATASAGVNGRRHPALTPAPTREIMMVEDSATDAALAVRAFQRARISNPIKTFRDGESALAYLLGSGRYAKRKPGRPQLILLDLSLPGMSGLEFLRRIKGDARTRAIPIVVLTGSRSDRSIMECARLGAENYIFKPVGIENFVRVTPKLNLHLTLGPPAEARNKTSSV